MVYIFGQGKNLSIIYAIETLSEKDKVGGILFNSLPKKEEKEGFIAYLNLSEDKKTLFWTYEKVPEEAMLETLKKGND
jgi:hypothetical protein